ncbi:MAG: glutaminyl-peptide cyclotransferase [Bacteroidales bacterium]|nr:glutaminyl-peptide cyclotransferase [Bacteroidales bacterium]
MATKQISILLITFLPIAFNCCSNNRIRSVPKVDITYIGTYPHDTTSFTEGFLIHNSQLYESTGAARELPQTKSLFGIVDLKNGKIEIKVELDRAKYFGEGIAFFDGKIFELTYRTKIGFVYDAMTFEKIKEFTFPSKEGWGLTSDGTNLIMSDGTSELTYLNPGTLQMVKKITVTIDGREIRYLNELEYINGYIFANRWPTNIIFKIDPADGKVVGKLDLDSIANEAKNIFSGSMEMNGIAYDSIKNRIFVTGKLWPKIYELQIDK